MENSNYRSNIENTSGFEKIDEVLSELKRLNLDRVIELLDIEYKSNMGIFEYFENIFNAIGKMVDGVDGGADHLLNIIKLGIKNTEDVDFLVDCLSRTSSFDRMNCLIEQRKKLGLGSNEINYLLSGLAKSKEYKSKVKEILLDKNEMHDIYKDKEPAILTILENMQEPEFSKRFIDEIVADKEHVIFLRPNIIANIIAQTRDTYFIKKYYFDTDFIKKRNINQEDLLILAEASKDKAIIMEYFDDNEKKNILTIKQRSKLLLAMNDQDEIRRAILNSKKYGLDSIEVVKLAFNAKLPIEEIRSYPTIYGDKTAQIVLAIYSKDYNYIRENLNEFDGEISLPEEMIIGIEIECIGRISEVLKKEKEVDGWKCKDDPTIKGKDDDEGVELASPKLTGDNQQKTKEIKTISGTLTIVGQYTNDSCGGHIHIGTNYLTSVQAFNNLRELWANNEKILYTISNKEGELPRPDILKYAAPISKEMETKLKETIQIDDNNDLEKFKKQLAKRQENRNKGINFKNLEEGGKGTIEFRLSNGTVDPKIWIENINLYGGLVRASEEISIIQAKNPEERSKEECEKLSLFDRIGTDKNLSEEERLDLFIKLVISDKRKRQTYIDRYKINSKLLKENDLLDFMLNEQISTSIIRYSDKKAIAKSIFIGENEVKGTDLYQIDKLINIDSMQLAQNDSEVVPE